MKKISNVIWGVILIAVGLIFALNALEITNIDLFFDGWWAVLFIIIPCILSLFKGGSKTWNTVGIIIGILLVLCCQGILDFTIFSKLFLPAVIILLGIWIIFRDTAGKKISAEITAVLNKSDSSKAEYCSTFSGQNLNFDGSEIENMTVSAIFGGIDLDLRGAVINSDKVINASAIFGGIDIKVPDNVNIKVKSTSVFGGIDFAKKPYIEGRPTVYVDGTCIFGGVDVK